MPEEAVLPEISRPRQIFETLVRYSAYAGAGAVVFIMAITLADVIPRYLFGRGLYGTVEIGEVALVSAVWLGLAYAELDRAHVRTNIVTGRISPRAARVMRLFGYTIMLLFVAWLCWESVFRAIHSVELREYRFGIVRVPIWPGKVALAIGTLLMAIQAGLELFDLGRGREIFTPEYEAGTELPQTGEGAL